ncbi:hypothetical protein N9L68_07255 [bacterium]|nr:hypothetical protein [bacterium]
MGTDSGLPKQDPDQIPCRMHEVISDSAEIAELVHVNEGLTLNDILVCPAVQNIGILHIIEGN